jgi:hypothetical protein
MQKDQQAPATRRIDLSNCKLLSPYGRNAADSLKVDVKVGGLVKEGVVIKTGLINKFGLITKLSPVSSARLARSSSPTAIR